jgi:hypothetical protein
MVIVQGRNELQRVDGRACWRARVVMVVMSDRNQ